MSDLGGRTVLVTGAGGFIGGHLTAALVRRGARVRAFVRYNSRNDRGTLSWLEREISQELETILGDLRDVESVFRAVKGSDLVFHLGAQIAIPYSYVNPRDFFETNVLGSLNVAQSVLEYHVGQVIHVSTSEVYGTAQSVPISEDHPLSAQSPYAASKIGADKLMDSYYHAYGLPVTVIRPFNTYGPHQSARAVVPTIITQAITSGTLNLGSLEPRRDLTYVTDTVDGILAATDKRATLGRTIQLGTGEDVSVGQLVETIAELLGKELHVNHEPERLRPSSSEVGRLVSDPSLARELLGWQAQMSLRQGLMQTISWIEAHSDRFRIDEYVI